MPDLFKTKSYLLVVSLLLLLTGACHTYYKATPASAGNTVETAGSIDSLQRQNRYFILRSGSSSYSIKNLFLSEDRKTMQCRLEALPPDHQLHLTLGIKRKNQYKKSTPEGIQVLREVHFFIPPDTLVREGNYLLALDRVQKIEVIEHDKKRTTNSYVIGAIGYTLGAAAIVGIIVAATKSSCPFVSAWDGQDFSLQGEIFGGAIYPQLARDDYMPLKMAPLRDGTLQLKISNELQERQYTDLANLWVITHDKNTRVLVDEQGSLYSIADPQSPLTATLNGKKNVLGALKKAGDYELLYLDDTTSTDARNEVILAFKQPEKATNARLLLTLKNSYWLDLLYGELAKGLGTYYASYIKQQKTKPAAELLKWVKEQQIPLEISVKTNQGWQRVGDITTIGPLATREIVVPVELPVNSDGPLEIKLSSGFMFWEIDQAALDFSPANVFKVEKLLPYKATDEQGKTVLYQLEREDGLYLDQPEIGNVATIVYKSKFNPTASQARTYILHTRGYYEHIRDFKNKPDPAFLSQFKMPNAFPLYGMQLYRKMNHETLRSLAGVH